MKKIIEKLKEIQSGDTGVIVYSPYGQNEIASYNRNMTVPLASAGKLAFGHILAKWVKRNVLNGMTLWLA